MRTFKNENNRGFTSVPVPMTITNKIKQFTKVSQVMAHLHNLT